MYPERQYFIFILKNASEGTKFPSHGNMRKLEEGLSLRQHSEWPVHDLPLPLTGLATIFSCMSIYQHNSTSYCIQKEEVFFSLTDKVLVS